MLQNTINGIAMLANLCKALGDDIVAQIYYLGTNPTSRSSQVLMFLCIYLRMLIIMFTKSFIFFNTFKNLITVEDLLEALVIGIQVVDSNNSMSNLQNMVN